jgi:DNA repair exonuclease SbcCD ATPase subunit
MGDFDRRGTMLERAEKRRPASSRLADLGDRLARSFSRIDPPDPDWDADGDLVHVERTRDWGPPAPPASSTPRHQPRFPITRQGYECEAVDEYVGDLERELVELERELDEAKASTPSTNHVEEEIQRVGEQTSAILLAAHDKAQETTRQAQVQADRVLADAAAQAIAVTEDANRKLQQLESDQRSLYRERSHLLEDIRRLSGSLSELADGATERFPSEPEPIAPEPVAADEATAFIEPPFDHSQTAVEASPGAEE